MKIRFSDAAPGWSESRLRAHRTAALMTLREQPYLMRGAIRSQFFVNFRTRLVVDEKLMTLRATREQLYQLDEHRTCIATYAPRAAAAAAGGGASGSRENPICEGATSRPGCGRARRCSRLPGQAAATAVGDQSLLHAARVSLTMTRTLGLGCTITYEGSLSDE